MLNRYSTLAILLGFTILSATAAAQDSGSGSGFTEGLQKSENQKQRATLVIIQIERGGSSAFPQSQLPQSQLPQSLLPQSQFMPSQGTLTVIRR